MTMDEQLPMQSYDDPQWAFFYEIFARSLPRQGPGDDASTLRALHTLLPPSSVPASAGLRILDIGCGSGQQTLQLARHAPGKIVAIDNHQPFLDEVESRAKAEGLSDRIAVRLQDMHDLGPEDGVFDLIWAEGSLFVMGFLHGIEVCHGLLAPGGLLAASELVWFRADAPAECVAFLTEEYPPTTDIAGNLAAIEARGFQVVDWFPLPEAAWLAGYYGPLEKRLDLLRGKYAGETRKLEMLAGVQREIDIYRRYSAFYGYAFFLLKKAETA